MRKFETDAWSSIHECHSLKMRSERLRLWIALNPFRFQDLEGFQRLRIISYRRWLVYTSQYRCLCKNPEGSQVNSQPNRSNQFESAKLTSPGSLKFLMSRSLDQTLLSPLSSTHGRIYRAEVVSLTNLLWKFWSEQLEPGRFQRWPEISRLELL